jgi:radical SAM additional 4Fe4S-binding domain
MNNLSYHDEDIVVYDNVSEKTKQQYQQWKDLTYKLSEIAYRKEFPLNLTLELTPECNLECKMCYVRLNKSEMTKIGKLLTADEWINIAKGAVEQGTLFVMFTGGEPLLHPEFEKIYTEISKLGCRICLLTNGVHITDRILELLKTYPPASILFTLYGASENTYQKVCNNGKAFYSVINNIRKIKALLSNIPLYIRATLIKDNIDDLESMKDIVKEFDVSLGISVVTMKAIRGAVRPEVVNCRLSQDEIKDVLYKNLHFDKITDENKIEEIREDKTFFCIAGIGSCVVSWDGKMLPCLMFSSPYTEPVKEGFLDSWTKLKKLRKEISYPDRCLKCKNSDFCGTCPAFIQAESGTYLNNESYECNKKY